ncbi:hypothetical protein EZS27_037792 [termite gut metagenome]|uniref:Uncharacterized protein n=1 Tax=termite gut metagenome TaxID=433724 RepID=A0A5J4PR51_9ZZZZ
MINEWNILKAQIETIGSCGGSEEGKKVFISDTLESLEQIFRNLLKNPIKIDPLFELEKIANE